MGAGTHMLERGKFELYIIIYYNAYLRIKLLSLGYMVLVTGLHASLQGNHFLFPFIQLRSHPCLHTGQLGLLCRQLLIKSQHKSNLRQNNVTLRMDHVLSSTVIHSMTQILREICNNLMGIIRWKKWTYFKRCGLCTDWSFSPRATFRTKCKRKL